MRFMSVVLIFAGTGYLHDAGERRENDYDIGSRELGDNFTPSDAMNSDEENGTMYMYIYVYT